MAKFEQRIKARELRREGVAINKIADELGVSKGTVSVWCEDIYLTPLQIYNNYKNRPTGLTNKNKKKANVLFFEEEGSKEIKKLSRSEFFIAGVCLYWAEGCKKSKLDFANSDPEMIIFMVRWFQDILNINREDLMPRLFINQLHKERKDEIVDYWSNLLQLPKEQFGNVTFLKTNLKKVYENHNSYFGVLHLRIRRSTLVKYKILGLIKAIKNADVA